MLAEVETRLFYSTSGKGGGRCECTSAIIPVKQETWQRRTSGGFEPRIVLVCNTQQPVLRWHERRMLRYDRQRCVHHVFFSETRSSLDELYTFLTQNKKANWATTEALGTQVNYPTA